MTDQEKITALRDALRVCQGITDSSDIYDTCGNALAMTAEASEGATDERAAFEAWARPWYNLDHHKDDDSYIGQGAYIAWKGWQARAKLEGSDK